MKNDKMPYNDKGVQHGLWERYHYNGELWFKCVYLNGNPNGFEELYYCNGKLTHKKYHL